MNQNTIYIIIGVVVIILVGMWAVNRADAPANDEMATSTASTTPLAATSVTIGSTPEPTVPVASRPRGDFADGNYVLSTDASVVGWIGRKPRVFGYEDTGTLKLSGGSIVVADGHIVSGDFTIDMATLTTDSTSNTRTPADRLTEHLKSDDFFAVETYPTVTFKIRNVINGVVSGDLTVKGITKTISFPATISADGDTLSAKAAITLNRAQWDIRYGSGSFFENLGDNLIADEVSITLDLVASK